MTEGLLVEVLNCAGIDSSRFRRAAPVLDGASAFANPASAGCGIPTEELLAAPTLEEGFVLYGTAAARCADG